MTVLRQFRENKTLPNKILTPPFWIIDFREKREAKTQATVWPPRPQRLLAELSTMIPLQRPRLAMSHWQPVLLLP
jgi:hypothetical protein